MALEDHRETQLSIPSIALSTYKQNSLPPTEACNTQRILRSSVTGSILILLCPSGNCKWTTSLTAVHSNRHMPGLSTLPSSLARRTLLSGKTTAGATTPASRAQVLTSPAHTDPVLHSSPTNQRVSIQPALIRGHMPASAVRLKGLVTRSSAQILLLCSLSNCKGRLLHSTHRLIDNQGPIQLNCGICASSQGHL